MNGTVAVMWALLAAGDSVPASETWGRILWPSIVFPIVISGLAVPMFGRKQKVLLTLGIVFPWLLFGYRCFDIANDHVRWAEFERPGAKQEHEKVAEAVAQQEPPRSTTKAAERDVSLRPLGTANTEDGYYYMMSFVNEDPWGFHGKVKVSLVDRDGQVVDGPRTLQTRDLRHPGEAEVAHFPSTIPPKEIDPEHGVAGARFTALIDDVVIAEGKMDLYPLTRTDPPFRPSRKVNWVD